MRRLAGAAFGLTASLFMTEGGFAATEITRACFPGFCVESREAFMVARGPHRRGWHVLRVSRTQSALYLEAGAMPEFPHCQPLCHETREGGEPRAYQPVTNRLVSRLVGPFPACREGEPDFFVHLFVYDASASPARFEIVRECG